ncbi:MAG: cytochrome c oxidase subunit II [Phycisphaerae bacterium]
MLVSLVAQSLTLPVTLAQWGEGHSVLLPAKHSTFADSVDKPFWFIFWVSLVFFAIIVSCAVGFVVAYRRTPSNPVATSNVTHNTPIELAWSILPGFLLVIMFWWGFKGFINMRVMPEDAYTINVEAQQWNWSFTYPNGFSTDTLHVPADTNVKLVMGSVDVLHAMYIPDFRAKQDVVPGRYSYLWFNAPNPGEHMLFCAEYCGKDHSNMTKTVVVHAKEDFPTWLANADPLSKLTEEMQAEWLAKPKEFIDAHPELVGLLPPAGMGEVLYKRKGCSSCHNVDGTTNQGPAWNGIWGDKSHTVLVGGAPQTVTVDENYIRESILDPGAKIREGFQNNMTSYQGRMKPAELIALIEYIKTLKE